LFITKYRTGLEHLGLPPLEPVIEPQLEFEE
jgi:hypothetical protein